MSLYSMLAYPRLRLFSSSKKSVTTCAVYVNSVSSLMPSLLHSTVTALLIKTLGQYASSAGQHKQVIALFSM